jgi:hypothetical protein
VIWLIAPSGNISRTENPFELITKGRESITGADSLMASFQAIHALTLAAPVSEKIQRWQETGKYHGNCQFSFTK